MENGQFEVAAPWRVNRDTDIAVFIRDLSLLGSRKHVLRLDVYPVQAPAHPERHHGYWDAPMSVIRRERTVLRLTEDGLVIRGRVFHKRLSPVWLGSLPLSGPAIITVSILDVSVSPAYTLCEKSSQHVLLHAADVFPLTRATIQVTRRCNLRCRGCKRQMISGRDSGHTPPEVVDAVIHAAATLSSVLIHADGEPLLNPAVPEILERLKKTMPAHGKVGLVTNGMRLDRDLARELVDRGLDWLAVSLDGARRQTMESIRRGSRFERILENVAFAVEYGANRVGGGMDSCVQFTTYPENSDEIPDMVRLSAKLGIPNLTIGHFLDYETGAFQPLPVETMGPLLEEAAEIGRRLGVAVKALPLKPLEPRQCPCLDEAVISVDGAVSLCNFRKPGMPEAPNFIVGRVTERPLHDIWDAEETRRIRRQLAAGLFPPQCEACCFSRWGHAQKL